MLGLDYSCNNFGTKRGICVEKCYDSICSNALNKCNRFPLCAKVSINSLKTFGTLKGAHKWKNTSIKNLCTRSWTSICNEYSNYPFFNSVSKNIIFDIGLHQGHDSALYIRQGYKVVAVEARSYSIKHPVLNEALYSGRFSILNFAISKESGSEIKFYTPKGHTELASIHKSTCLKTQCTVESVKTITCTDLLKNYPATLLLKVDIEGADMMCIESLRNVSIQKLPKYVSVEDNKAIYTLRDLGYSSFKMVAGIEMSSCMVENLGTAEHIVPNELGHMPWGCVNAITENTKWSSFKRTIKFKHFNHVHRFKPHDLYARLDRKYRHVYF
jgi:FkbM family methyltransferase